MKIKEFVAVFNSPHAAINFANIIAKNFFYVIEDNRIQVNARKIRNTEAPLFDIDGERLNAIATKSKDLLRVSY